MGWAKSPKFITVWLSQTHYWTLCSLHLEQNICIVALLQNALWLKPRVYTPKDSFNGTLKHVCLSLSVFPASTLELKNLSTFPLNRHNGLFITTDGKHVHISRRESFQTSRPLLLNQSYTSMMLLSPFWDAACLLLYTRLLLLLGSVEFTHDAIIITVSLEWNVSSSISPSISYLCYSYCNFQFTRVLLASVWILTKS